MTLIVLAQTFVALTVACFLGLVVLRALGYRVEFRLKAIKGRRRRPVEPDEHTQFL